MSRAFPTWREPLTVTSAAFADGETIPQRYTCRGAGQFPELAWHGVPPEATSVVLVVSDPDAPRGTFVHWLVYNLPAGDGRLTTTTLPMGAQQAQNSTGRPEWFAPCPPSGEHRYLFTIYAMSQPLLARSTPEILAELAGYAAARGTLTGRVAAP